MTVKEKRRINANVVFAVLTVTYIAFCAVIWCVYDSLRNSSYVEPLPLEMSAADEPVIISKTDLNTALAEELMAISGIGEVMAGNIIEYREQNGGFTDVDELLEVRGIGKKTLAKIRPYLTV